MYSNKNVEIKETEQLMKFIKTYFFYEDYKELAKTEEITIDDLKGLIVCAKRALEEQEGVDNGST